MLDVKTPEHRSEPGISFVEVANPRITDIGVGHFVRAVFFAVAAIHPLVRMIEMRQVDVIHSHSQIPALICIIVKRLTRSRIPIVHTVHNPHILAPRSPWLLLLHFWEILTLKHCDFVIAETETGARSLCRRYKLDRCKVGQVYSGVDIEKINSAVIQHARTTESPSVRILSVGRVTRRKGQMTLIDSVVNLFKQRIDFRLTIVGEIDDRRYYHRIQRIVAQSGLQNRVVFTGEVDSGKLVDWFLGSDIFVFPSLAETQGLAILEAMAFGLPTVAARLDPLVETVGGCNCVLFFRAGDAKGLAYQLGRLISDRKLRRDSGERGRAWAQQYSWRRTAMETTRIYRILISKSQARGSATVGLSGLIRPRARTS